MEWAIGQVPYSEASLLFLPGKIDAYTQVNLYTHPLGLPKLAHLTDSHDLRRHVSPECLTPRACFKKVGFDKLKIEKIIKKASEKPFFGPNYFSRNH